MSKNICPSLGSVGKLSNLTSLFDLNAPICVLGAIYYPVVVVLVLVDVVVVVLVVVLVVLVLVLVLVLVVVDVLVVEATLPSQLLPEYINQPIWSPSKNSSPTLGFDGGASKTLILPL